MNNIGPRRLQHFLEIGVGCRNPDSLPQLFGHEHFPIANRHDLAIRDPPDGVDMLVSHLPTTYYGNAQHCRHRLEISFVAQKHSTTNTNSPAHWCSFVVRTTIKLGEETRHRLLHRDTGLPSQTFMKLFIGVTVSLPLSRAPPAIEHGGQLVL